jgi:hypothetical protein
MRESGALLPVPRSRGLRCSTSSGRRQFSPGYGKVMTVDLESRRLLAGRPQGQAFALVEKAKHVANRL